LYQALRPIDFLIALKTIRSGRYESLGFLIKNQVIGRSRMRSARPALALDARCSGFIDQLFSSSDGRLIVVRRSRVQRGALNTAVVAKDMAEVEYRDITPEGLLRQSSFKGLMRD
jgi:hypothetical protein